MGDIWRSNRIKLSILLLLTLLVEFQLTSSLNSEGLALLEFCGVVDSDPYGSFESWNHYDANPCKWSGVQCLDGKVEVLDLEGKSLRGGLDPALGELSHLRYLLLSKNQFFGGIPKKLGQLSVLEVLDLRDNNLTGTVPAEIGELQSLKRLLLSNNYFKGSIPSQLDVNLTSAVAEGIGGVNRKIGHCTWKSNFKLQRGLELLMPPLKGVICRYLYLFQLFGKDSMHSHFDSSICSTEPHIIQPVHTMVYSTRRRLAEKSKNLAAVPVNGDYIIYTLPTRRSSNLSHPASSPVPPPRRSPTFSAQPSRGPDNNDLTDRKSDLRWKYIVGISSGVFLLIVAVVVWLICRTRTAKSIGPWKTGLSGQLQKAFVTGVPKLKRAELEQACEDFSNVISTHEAYTTYKGTLSSGVEIIVASTALTSLTAWKSRTEAAYRQKIVSLSRVNHKNFLNLIGYSEENEPFARMMVFEYAPNGTLYEHLHVKEAEHLDWNARMRIVMGTAYCLQYMHELQPPLPHSHLISHAIYLTEDYAAKVGDISFWSEFMSHSKSTGESGSDRCELPPLADAGTNVYDFGLLLLEVISGKVPNSEEQLAMVQWAELNLNDKQSIRGLIDPTLESFKDHELEKICEVIKECIQQDVRKRPSIQEVIAQLSVLDISPNAATPKLSPLWWAELEILSAEAP